MTDVEETLRKIAATEAERDSLKSELAEANARIDALNVENRRLEIRADAADAKRAKAERAFTRAACRIELIRQCLVEQAEQTIKETALIERNENAAVGASDIPAFLKPATPHEELAALMTNSEAANQ